MTPQELIAHGDHLFGKRGSLLSLWQELADNFYPERADFTVNRTLGDEFASHLSTSYPILVRRSLGDAFSAMLRPVGVEWFHNRALREEDEDQQALAWLEWATATQRRAMYDRRSQFKKASKQGDHDTATFGQNVKSIEVNSLGDGLLYRCWHLRDCAWSENAEGLTDTLHRKWKPTARDLMQLFRDKIHSRVQEKLIGAKKEPYCEIQCRHIVMPAAQFDGDYVGKGRGHPYVSIYVDVENMHIMEAVAMTYFMYVVPRWQTVSGSQYAYSPAAIAGLPDARLIQAMTYTLLEAGEKATNPPMVAVQEAIRSDIAIYSGGITYVDSAYDEREGAVLRPLGLDLKGFPIGVEMRNDVISTLSETFYTSKLSLPVNRPEMTAFEVGQYVQQYIRDASPIFEPLEDEDNAAVCETTFELMMQRGAFGSYQDIPQSIRGKETQFRFVSPLHDMIERQKGQKFAEARALLAETMTLDPTAPAHLDVTTAFRDALNGIGMPAKWMRSEEEAAKLIEADQMREQLTQTLEDMSAGATVAEQIGNAQQALSGPEAMAA